MVYCIYQFYEEFRLEKNETRVVKKVAFCVFPLSLLGANVTFDKNWIEGKRKCYQNGTYNNHKFP